MIEIQKTADKIKAQFKKLTNIGVSLAFKNKGNNHKPTPLKPKHCGVYAFGSGKTTFKVGKVGPKSNARWTRHHYHQTSATRSTLARSIMANKGRLKASYPKKKGKEIDAISAESIEGWIKYNMFRIEFIMEYNEKRPPNRFDLNLLEALAQYHFAPIFEGKNQSLWGP